LIVDPIEFVRDIVVVAVAFVPISSTIIIAL
jgi:hypothetical protein